MHASGKREASGSVFGSFSPLLSRKSFSLYNPDEDAVHVGQPMQNTISRMLEARTVRRCSAILTGLSVALLAMCALPGLAHGKGHGHSGGHGAHHSAHDAGSGLWRQSSGSASPGAGNTPAGHPSEVGQPRQPTSQVPITVLPIPRGP